MSEIKGIKLTSLQAQMLSRLRNEKKLYWTYSKSSETTSLKSLVKKGIAEVHELSNNGEYTKHTYWTLK